MKAKLIMAAALSMLFLAGIPRVCAQGPAYDSYPGYVDFGDLNIPENAEERVEIFLESPILKFVAKLSSAKEPEFGRFLEKIVLIKANIFSMEGGLNESLRERITSISNSLKSKNWQRAVYVKDKGDEFEIYMLLEGDKMHGLAVMGMDKGDDNAIFINIVGEIDPEQLGKLSRRFNIPGIDSIQIH